MLKIFNRIKNLKELFKFSKKKTINIYVCGITPYNYCHIGHARIFLIFDIIIRYFKYLGYKVFYIRNITDIDDKIIKESNLKNIHYKKLTSFFILEYRKLFKKLNILNPNYEPKVTENIEYIIKMIKLLIKKNFAYKNSKGDILFNTKLYNNYGYISNRKNIESKNFVLWKKNNLINDPKWKSPWGYGRPGWHIECSSICNKFFKNKIIDIHGGGIDLIFPHNENELSQLKCINKKFKIRNWINIENVNFLSKKISKSSENYIKLYEILNNFDNETIRFLLTKKHYRKPIEYNKEYINKCNNFIFNIYKNLYKLKYKDIIKTKIIRTEFTKEFIKSINDDFNTSNLYFLINEMSNNILNKNNNYCSSLKIAKEMINLGNLLGILNNIPKIYIKNYNKKNNKYSYKKINNLIKIRNLARKKKNWKLSDKIRKILLDKNNIIIKDNKKNSKWEYK